MSDSLDIRDVVRRTGLSSRALRFYEAKGLVAPLRTASGRRIYSGIELERLHQITVLKAAGLTLAQMKRLFDGRSIDFFTLLNTQLKLLDDEASQVEKARKIIISVLSRVNRGEPVDAETFCSLIESGDKMMNDIEKWDTITSRYFSETEKAEFADRMAHVPADFDQASYSAKWVDLGGRIKAALPIDPASEKAGEFLTEWNTLLQPFLSVATDKMKVGVNDFYGRMDEWQGQGEGQMDPGFDSQVFQFIQRAAAARK